MTQQVFAQFIDVSAASLSSIFNGRTRPTLNIVEAIKKKVPDISTDWLMFGTGSMYTSDQPARESVQPVDQEPALPFDDAPTPPYQPARQDPPRHQGVVNTPTKEVIKIIDKHERKIVEIKVYYDDQTYESFVPSKK